MVSVVGWLDKGEVSLFVTRFVFVALKNGLIPGYEARRCNVIRSIDRINRFLVTNFSFDL